jgi:hypothetical protein
VIDDPPALRRLEQWVVEHEHESTARREHARHLGDRTDDVDDVLEHEAREHGVERSVTERQKLSCASRIERAASPRPGSRELRHCRVETDRPRTES